MKVLSIAVLVMFAAATEAAAQSGSSVATGSRVRVSATGSSKPVTGVIVSQDERSLKLAMGSKGDIVIARSTIEKMDLSVKRKSRGGAGFALGLGAGVVFAVLSSGDSETPCYTIGGCYRIGKGGAAVLLGALLGATIGGAIRTDQWAPVDHRWRLNVVPARKGGAFGLSFAF